MIKGRSLDISQMSGIAHSGRCCQGTSIADLRSRKDRDGSFYCLYSERYDRRNYQERTSLGEE